ncbi:hypothetical protein BJX61DRAFT_535600 [Aspergillus egyptiacus]|nr:hypothetical protein BJX61DRAFT_535600 [Aspergillus egyptiacus]
MPIKLPKGFARRKSSGNALEDVENHPPSSFRVFERPSTARKSHSDGNIIARGTANGHDVISLRDDDENIFAGSDGPAVRNLTGGNTIIGRPTTGQFSSSTGYSRDAPSHFDSQSHHSRNLHDIPAPPVSGASRTAGRTFSFGGKLSKATAQVPHRASSPDTTRSRATTNSTASTATPPKFLDDEFQIGRMDDDFGNMFDNIGKQEAQGSARASRASNSFVVPDAPANSAKQEERAPRPAPINTDRSKKVDPSPFSWDRRHSKEGLLNGVDSPQEESAVLQSNTADSSSMNPHGALRKSPPMADAVPIHTTSHRSLEKPKVGTDKGLRRSVMFSTKWDTTAVEDEDAKLVRASVYSNKRASQAPISTASSISDSEDDVPLFDVKHKMQLEPAQQGLVPAPESAEDNLHSSIAAHAQLAAEYESKSMPVSSSNKVMTPSQFEHYRQQQELKSANSDASDSEDSAGSDFDDEDEDEKNREAEKQRRKQEAHMSVYRQQMMKVTGQQSPSPSLRPEERASNSAPNLANLSLHPGNGSGGGKNSEEDDDEEIPLGILAAHGFPNRNRPPSRLVSSNSMQNLRASYQPPHLGSAGSDMGGNRSSLPVFARNLPRDPYFGASLVTPSNRESLALGGGGSVYGGPSGAAAGRSLTPSLPPGGLVGVIATEERARAMRRGSPNTHALYEHQPGFAGSTGNVNGIPRPYTMLNMNSYGPSNIQPPMSATEQAQVQLSQQMGNMMQMQMQWMQQMIQLQGGQVPPQQFASPGIPSAQAANANSRPSSMPSAGGAYASPAYGINQRTLSMLDPNVSSRLNTPPAPFSTAGNRPGTPGGAGYAPSLAPSERSNVGLAPRYRPVSTLPAEAESMNFLPLPKTWNDENRKSAAVIPYAHVNSPNTTIRPVSGYNRSLAATSKLNSQFQPEEEDDEEGWAEMMKKREKKKSHWKTKKEASGFGDLLNAVH